jgi:DNA-directed RNA polymerase specialized sigma24 family protein
MFDPEALSSLRALEELGKEGTRRRLIAIAKWSTGSDADAEDLVSAALVEVLDPERQPWVAGKTTFLVHMSFVMRHVWNEELRRARVKREVVDQDVTFDQRTVSREPAADDELHRRRSLQVLRELGERLLAEIGEKFPVAKKVYELGAAGTEEADEQAAIIGCTVEEVREARRTLKHHAERIRHEHELAEERRMRAMRERAAKRGTEGGP